MSVGSIVGGIAGAIVGFFIGGPAGAFYGASIGFGVGMAIDPMMPDMPAPGTPNPDEAIMKSTIGNPIPDLAGTAKITPHLLLYGKERSEKIYSNSSGGGKGGGEPDPQIIGYEYYMSWAVGICSGQVDTLYAIYKNDELVWPAPPTKPDSSGSNFWDDVYNMIFAHDENLNEYLASGISCPVSGGQETLVLAGTGAIEFYFGTDDQVANTKVGEIIGDITLNSPLRNMCWAFFDDCYIGEYNRTPTFKFIVKPSNAFNVKDTIQALDCNPMHVLWYIFNGLSGLPETWLNDTNFSSAADTLYSEYRGISVLFDRQQTALSYIESINSHIDGIVRYGNDSQFHPKLIRDDYTVGDLQTIDETVMLGEPSFNRKAWIDTINEVKAQYSEIIDMERPKNRYALSLNIYDYDAGDGSGEQEYFSAMVIGIDKVIWGKQYHLQTDPDPATWYTGGYGAFSIIEVSDGLILAGAMAGTDSENRQAIIKVNKNTGVVVWSKIFENNGSDEYVWNIIETSDGSLCFVSRVWDYSGGLSDTCAITKLTSTGDIAWSKVLRGNATSREEVTCIRETSDGGFIACGWIDHSDLTNKHGLLVKLTSTGAISWTKTFNYATPITTYLYDVRELSGNDGYIVNGSSPYYDSEWRSKAFVMKLTTTGTIIWSKYVDLKTANSYTEGCAVREVSDGYIFTAHSYNYPNNAPYLYKIDLSGDLDWVRVLRSSINDDNPWQSDEGAMELSSDGSILGCGMVEGSTASIYGILIYNVEDDGMIGTYENIIDVTGDYSINNANLIATVSGLVSSADYTQSIHAHSITVFDTPFTYSTQHKESTYFVNYAEIIGKGSDCSIQPFGIIGLET